MTLFHGTAIVETRNEINEMEFSFTGGLYITGSPDLLTVRSLRGPLLENVVNGHLIIALTRHYA